MSQRPESDPRHHTQHVKSMLNETVRHLREDIGEIEEPRAEALFETTAEVLQGLIRAYEHYEKRSEEAWRS